MSQKNHCKVGNNHCTQGCDCKKLEQGVCIKCGQKTIQDKVNSKKRVCQNKRCKSNYFFCDSMRKVTEETMICPICKWKMRCKSYCHECNTFYFSQHHGFNAKDWKYHLVKGNCKTSRGIPLCKHHEDFPQPHYA